MPLGFTEYLREVAVRCDRIARLCSHDRTKQELEKLSLELAEKAVELNDGDARPAAPPSKAPPARPQPRLNLTPLEMSLAIVVFCTLIIEIIDYWFDLPHLVFAYLAPIVFIAARYGSRAGMLAAIASLLGAMYFFYPPKFSIYVVEAQSYVEMLVFCAIALLAVQFIAERTRKV